MPQHNNRNVILNDAGEIAKAGCVVHDDRGRILMISDKNGKYWSLPKGHLDPGETLEQAAARETKEETGYTVETGRRLPDLTYTHAQTGAPIRVALWEAEIVGERSKKADEVSDWLDYDYALTAVRDNLASYFRALY
jgi:8-oxo-dGTP pyrophosphatase MutT (NUDIX family)